MTVSPETHSSQANMKNRRSSISELRRFISVGEACGREAGKNSRVSYFSSFSSVSNSDRSLLLARKAEMTIMSNIPPTLRNVTGTPIR